MKIQLNVPALFIVLILSACGPENNLPEDSKWEIVDQAEDGDGNVYYAIQIGDQIWLQKNLETMTYNDGSSIPVYTSDDDWDDNVGDNGLSGRCVYDNEESNKAVYGYLYNFYAINPGSNGGKNACPKGYHIPTLTEFDELRLFIEPGSVGDGTNGVGNHLREQGDNHWLSPNADALDTYGFSGRGAGDRSGSTGSYGDLNRNANFWSSTEESSSTAFFLLLQTGDSVKSIRGKTKKMGFSCRCIKD